MPKTRVEIVQENLLNLISASSPVTPLLRSDECISRSSGLTAGQAIQLFDDQVTSRLLDVAARELRKTNKSFYTISSAGHEQNAVIGELLRVNDPCFLHYRSGALVMSRSRKVPGVDAVLDTALSFCASADDPISHGRHKVWGSKPLWIPPQTSTIASHVPKAAGMGFALKYAGKLGLGDRLEDDSIVCCSFGDASANHAAALTGINSARYAIRKGGTAPVLFLCEDNGIGISVDTPRNWIHDTYSGQKHLRYFEASGEIDEIWTVAAEAISYCRQHRSPVFLHLHVVRLWGHAGTDVEIAYRSVDEIEAAESSDPLLVNARRLISTGAATPAQLGDLISGAQERVDAACREAVRRPHLASVAQIVSALAPYDEEAIRRFAERPVDQAQRLVVWGEALPEHAAAPTRRTMAAHINAALTDEMTRLPQMTVFGEDVGRKGGVYYVTAGLQKRFGHQRCFDTLLDETTILGVAQGAAMAGLLPVPEIQYLAYLHNALDQIRGEACSLQYFSSGQFSNGTVVRVQGLAYQKGFGGHFHNDNSIGALRDIPGLILAVPSRGDDATKMLRGLIATAGACGRVSVFLEPIALYHERDLHEEGDGKWLFDYPAPGDILLPGEVGLYNGEASDLLIVTYANGLRLSLQAARRLQAEKGISARVLDLRWLNPLPMDRVLEHAIQCGRVLIADECRATGGGIADAVIGSLVEHGFKGALGSIRSIDTYIPLGAAANLVLISEEGIYDAALKLTDGSRPPAFSGSPEKARARRRAR